MPSDHVLASQKEIAGPALIGETFIGVSDTAPSLQRVIAAYLSQAGLDLRPAHAADNLAMAMSLVASTRGVALLPAYAQNFLPWSVTSRPLVGRAPTIDLVIGYNRANPSTVLKQFLAQVDGLIEQVSAKHLITEREGVFRSASIDQASA